MTLTIENFRTKGWFTLGPSKAEPSQTERGVVFTLAQHFPLDCAGCSACEVWRAALVYATPCCKQVDDGPLQRENSCYCCCCGTGSWKGTHKEKSGGIGSILFCNEEKKI